MASKGKKDKSGVKNRVCRFRIKPTAEQMALFERTFGCVRRVYNLMLSDRKLHYEATGKDYSCTPAEYKGMYPYLAEVDSYALCNAQVNLNRAYANFFAGRAGFPRFKSRRQSNPSYTTNVKKGTRNVALTDQGLILPKVGCVAIICHRPVPDGTLTAVTITRETDEAYYAALLYELPDTPVAPATDRTNSIGLDMSLPHFFVDSDGHAADYPRFYREAQAKLAKEQRRLSRMHKGSRNYQDQLIKIGKLHAKTKHQRADFLNKLSFSLAETYSLVCIEDLNMQNMARSLKLGKSVMDNGWGMFVRMLAYKLADRGKTLLKVDRFFASSKTCLACGRKHTGLKLSDRIFVCPHCGHTIDRDYQAAINILNEGLRCYDRLIAPA